jgi:hypothetical protein
MLYVVACCTLLHVVRRCMLHVAACCTLLHAVRCCMLYVVACCTLLHAVRCCMLYVAACCTSLHIVHCMLYVAACCTLLHVVRRCTLYVACCLRPSAGGSTSRRVLRRGGDAARPRRATEREGKERTIYNIERGMRPLCPIMQPQGDARRGVPRRAEERKATQSQSPPPQ